MRSSSAIVAANMLKEGVRSCGQALEKTEEEVLVHWICQRSWPFQGDKIISDAKTKSPSLKIGHVAADRVMSHGLSCNIVNIPGMEGVFRIAPPVTVSADKIEE